MDSKWKKEESPPQTLLTTDPKILLRKPKMPSEKSSLALKIIAAIAGSILAILLVSQWKRFF